MRRGPHCLHPDAAATLHPRAAAACGARVGDPDPPPQRGCRTGDPGPPQLLSAFALRNGPVLQFPSGMPLDRRPRVRVWPGNPYPLGANWTGVGVNFALFSAHATKVELCLFESAASTTESARIPLP